MLGTPAGPVRPATPAATSDAARGGTPSLAVAVQPLDFYSKERGVERGELGGGAPDGRREKQRDMGLEAIPALRV